MAKVGERTRYLGAALVVIAAGVVSRSVPIGNLIFDKYAGDALYAVLLYLILRILWPGKRWSCLIFAVLGMILIESFQLTGIPLSMRQSGSTVQKLISIALGTKFAWADLLAYAIGIGIAFGIDACCLPGFRATPESKAVSDS